MIDKEKYEELLEFVKWCAEDSFCTGEDAYSMQQEARQTLIKIGEKE